MFQNSRTTYSPSSCTGLLWLSCWLWINPALAQSAPAKPAAAIARAAVAAEARVGTPPTAVKVSLELRKGQVFLRAGKAEALLPLSEAAPLAVENVALRRGGAAVVQVGPPGQPGIAALITRGPAGVAVAWVGDLRWHGDPGERVADAIETADRDADGIADVVVGTYDERVRLCGQEHTILAARSLDTGDLQLKALRVLPTGVAAPTQTLTASQQSPGPTGLPLLAGLRVSGASAAEAGSTANQLLDHKPDAVWAAGQGHAGKFEFVTLRWDGNGQPIRALAVIAPQADAAHAAQWARPKRLLLVADHGQVLRAELPAEPKDAKRWWITPQAPLQTTCLSVIFEDTEAAGPSGDAAAALGELEAYTDLDFPGGLQRAVEAMLQDGPHASDAADLLVHVNADLSAPIAAAWPKLSTQARRRAVRVLGAHVEQGAKVQELLARAVADPESDVAQAALEAQLAALPSSEATLEGLATQNDAIGDRVMVALARKAPVQAVALGLKAIGATGGAERTKVRDAVALGLEHGGVPALGAAQAWVDASAAVPLAGRASAALALCQVPTAAPLALRLVHDGLAAATEFSDQWRLVNASAKLGADVDIDAWLAKLATSADAPWMLRAAALAALSARGATQAKQVATQALADPYPRVRTAALASLANGQDGVELLSRYARDDKWFLVRTAALDGLPKSPRAESTLRAALADKTAAVRAAAIAGLRRQAVISAWTAIAPHVEDPKEYPEVIGEGISFARVLCVADATAALEAVVVRGLKPEAWQPDQELALGALEALGMLGGSGGTWAADQANNPLVPAPVRAKLERAAKSPTACVPTP